jgi:hypothetical protein
MSWFSSLFGGKSDASAEDAGATREYKGYLITATPLKEGGQYRLCGVISKDVDGVRKEHRFIRADQFTSKDDAVQFAFAKGELIVDQSGAGMFE